MRHLRPLRGAARRVFTVPTIVAFAALFVALGGPAEAVTGGNFILGQSNTANNQTSLTSSGAGAPALSVTNSGTSAGSVPLNLTASSGIAPLRTNSTTKVAHLNADLLDGVDSTAFQRDVTGTCSGGSAITAISGAGAVTCESSATLELASNDIGPLPKTAEQTFTLTKTSLLEITFEATGYRATADGSGPVGAALWLCHSSPCSAGTSVSGVDATTFANLTNVHTPAMVIQEAELLPGNYVIGMSANVGTTTDSNDRLNWSIVSFGL